MVHFYFFTCLPFDLVPRVNCFGYLFYVRGSHTCNSGSDAVKYAHAPFPFHRRAAVALSKVIPFNLADIGEAIAEVELVQWCVSCPPNLHLRLVKL